MFRRLTFWFIDFGLLLILWLAFVFKLDWQEALVGIGAAALGAFGAAAVRATGHPRFQPRLSWILEFRSVPGQIARDTAALTGRLFLMIFRRDTDIGRIIAVPFQTGGSDGRSVARRMLAVTYASISPDAIVMNIDRANNRVFVHVLTSRRAPDLLRRLGEDV